MRNKTFILPLVLFLIAIIAISCEKDSFIDKGYYLYQDSKLYPADKVNNITIIWNDNDLPENIKQTVLEIASSMVEIQSGVFDMGTYSSGIEDEGPTHSVYLSEYHIAKTTITQQQWQAIMGSHELWNEQYGKGDNYPANYISYTQALEFINKLNSYSNLRFRLPTEAEWEFAACGGTVSHDYLYSGSNNANEVAWHRDNAQEKMHPVAMLNHNELGLYDMSGNVWEWCFDYYGEYPNGHVNNPTGPSHGEKRMVRGGSFSYEAAYSRCKCRNCLPETNNSFAVGLRLAM